MTGVLGIIYAYHAQPDLGALVARRTAASLPFCARYRAIDFALSGMANGGIRDVGVVMQRDYQSLLDHLGNGRDWDLNRRGGGLRLLPPFGLPDSSGGQYSGCIAALQAVSSYIADSDAEYVLLQRGNLIVNLDTADIIRSHIESGVDITAVCGTNEPNVPHHSYIVGSAGTATGVFSRRAPGSSGVPALEVYITRRSLLLDLLEKSREHGWERFHSELMTDLIASGGRVGVYMHDGYALPLETVEDYYRGNMDMLDSEVRAQIFPAGRPVYTKERADVSTYYGPGAQVKNCLVADGCYIEGQIENCVIFRGVRIGSGAVIKNSIIMQDSAIGSGAVINRVITDKNVSVSAGVRLSGTDGPMVIAKSSRL